MSKPVHQLYPINVTTSKVKELPLEFYVLVWNFINEQKKVDAIWRLMKPHPVSEAFLKISLFYYLFMSLTFTKDLGKFKTFFALTT